MDAAVAPADRRRDHAGWTGADGAVGASHGPDFAAAPMVWQSDADDGIKVWPQMGFHVKRGGVDLTVTPTISGMNVLLAVTETISAGDSLEVILRMVWAGRSEPRHQQRRRREPDDERPALGAVSERLERRGQDDRRLGVALHRNGDRMSTTTYTGVRITDMPDLGAGHRQQFRRRRARRLGRFGALALRTYATTGVVPFVASVAALRALATGAASVSVQGYYAAGDGGGGDYVLGAAGTDNGGSIVVSGAGTYYLQTHGAPLNVLHFGAKGDGTTDDALRYRIASMLFRLLEEE